MSQLPPDHQDLINWHEDAQPDWSRFWPVLLVPASWIVIAIVAWWLWA